MSKTISKFIERLDEWHSKRDISIQKHQSDIVSNQFPGEFNVSGFHKKILELPGKASSSFWGIDKCLRIKESVDDSHSYVFNMGIFAESMDLESNFSNPFKDKKFREFQEKIMVQFFSLLKNFKLDFKSIEATYLGEIIFGASSFGRDKGLVKRYSFPTDENSRELLKKFKIKSYKVNSISNLDIQPLDGALVGPRVEIAYRGVEIATLVFDCFTIKDGKLIPINYVGGYALGIERLFMVSQRKSSLIGVGENEINLEKLKRVSDLTESDVMKKDVLRVVFGLEVNKILSNKNFSEKQKEIFRRFKRDFNKSLNALGLKEQDIR